MKLKLGNEAKDKITQFQGIVTGKSEFLTGCDQYLIQPPCKENVTYPEARWFDEGRLDFLSNGINKEYVAGEKPGCDYNAPIK